VIVASVTAAMALAYLFHTGPVHCPNDQSRWNTVWSLVERGTYAIDGAPWEGTIDKIRRPDGHFYSSKPPLMPTVLAGEYWLIKHTLGLDLKEKTGPVVRIILITTNIIPLFLFVLCWGKLVERFVEDPWWRAYWLIAGAVGTYLTGYCTTLNNHIFAGFAVMFSLYFALRIEADHSRRPWDFALLGASAAWAACNEVPGVLFTVPVLAYFLWRAPKQTALFALPPAVVLGAAFLWTQYLATGGCVPVYLKFDSSLYQYEGSYWTQPTGIDAQHEPKLVYLTHMLLGHHGIFTLTPIFVLSAVGLWGLMRDSKTPHKPFQWLAACLTGLLVVLYMIRTNNYGGVCNGLRWVFWLTPLWLLAGAMGVRYYARMAWARRAAVPFLAVSAFSALYALCNPWTRSWLEDLFLWARIIDYYK